MKHFVKHLLGAVFFVEEHTGLEVGFPTHAHQKQVLALQINQADTPKAGPCTASQPSCRMPASACLPAAMCHAKGQIASLPCSYCCASVYCLLAWPAALAAVCLGLRALLPTSAFACCWDAARTSTVSQALLAQCSPNLHAQEQRKGPNKSKMSQRIESKLTAPRSRGGKGLLSHGFKVQFSIQKL